MEKKIYCPFCGNPSMVDDNRELRETNRALLEQLDQARSLDQEWFNDATSTINELRQRAEAAEARAAQAESHNANLMKEVEQWRIHVEHVEQDRDEARAELEQAHNREQMDRAVMTEASAKIDEMRAELEQTQRALLLADVGNFDALCGWISGAQSELHQARLTIDNLTSPRDDFPYEGDEMEALQREAGA